MPSLAISSRSALTCGFFATLLSLYSSDLALTDARASWSDESLTILLPLLTGTITRILEAPIPVAKFTSSEVAPALSDESISKSLPRLRAGEECGPAGPPRHGVREERRQGARLQQGPDRTGAQWQCPDGERDHAGSARRDRCCDQARDHGGQVTRART